LVNFYAGGSAFLVCGGPSLTQLDLSLLKQRGVLVAAFNNVAATTVQPNLWVSSDPVGHFCDIIWRDPTILKFVPLSRMNNNIRVWEGDKLVEGPVVSSMPSLIWYDLRSGFIADRWLYEPECVWGNEGANAGDAGYTGARSTMLSAIKILFVLGIRTIYLLGADFKMEVGKDNYAFPQARSRESVSHNNRTYEVLVKRFELLLPYFEKENFEIFNCNFQSNLRVFPFISYEEALERATFALPKEVNTFGMYNTPFPPRVPERGVQRRELPEYRKKVRKY